MKIDTVLFDLDGTLINTNELIIASFLHTLEHYRPGEYTREAILEFIGPPLVDSFKTVDPDLVDEMIERYRTFNHEKHDELVEEYEGVKETVQQLHQAGIKLAIVTTKIRKTAMMGLQLTGLDQYFDVIISLDEVDRVKPDPQPLQLAMDALGSKPDTTIMVGDNHHDINGGKNAGTKTAGVAWAIKGEEFIRSYEPDYVLQSMNELLEIVGVESD
ncbi:pyrophosphatase PpaX [Alkalihalobacillus sp. LMS39]|uniref:pyrophosphatase PpaX n=1 Tax=Alkalihalobacillus sp. LMS39 TaxID=2924032 RepID=UPI001FB36A8C|nr:pyrophosphatase PpaX [Alkalihalobacillus sp. LMS39]UOE93758.1 pyrophosphatase PpaX [Alkalihalobacillus sp. LMS39]